MRVGVIGFGRRLGLLMKEFFKQDPDFHIAAIADIDPEGVRLRWAETGHGVPVPKLYESADGMLSSEPLDGIMIGTRCFLHTEMALKALPLGIPLFLEKPVATTLADWRRLRDGAAPRRLAPVVVSFPLRHSPIVELAKELIDSGSIGPVSHVQAVNNVVYGGTYFHSWYRDEKETGGLFLQKTTHDFDYIQYLIGGVKPVSVCAATSKQVFRGDKPAGLRCGACDDRSCDERAAPYGSPAEPGRGYCCFASDTGNEDSASAIVTYENGMHLSYSQNFVVRRAAGSRGARLIGYKGTLEFDFHTGKLEVYKHHQPRTESYSIDPEGPHFGGDPALARNFLEVMAGRERPRASLEDGLLSALMCLKAKESAENKAYRTIEWE